MADDKKITIAQFKKFAKQADTRLDDLEANRAKGQCFTLNKSDWTEDSGDENFPYQYKLMIEDVTAASQVNAVLDANSVVVAVVAGVCSVNETTDDGNVVFKSCEVPTEDLTGILYIKKTAAMSGSE